MSLIATATTELASILAQVPDVAPTSAGMPGADMVTKLIGWARWVGIMACLGGFIFGAGNTAIGERSGNTMMARKGKEFLIGSLLGAALLGMAPVLLNAFYAAS